MRIGRTLPPATAPIYPIDVFLGLIAIFKGKSETLRFEKELKLYFDKKFCFLVSSGKAALTITLKALKEIYPERDEVLIPAYNCFSVPSAITRAGLKIRLCDVDDTTLDYNYDQLSEILNTSNTTTKKLLAVIPTHLFGLPANITRLREHITDPKITVIEDAAQAMGGVSNGKKLGTLGDVSFFSLGRGKAFSTVEGGIILTDRADIAEKIRDQFAAVSNYSFIEQLKLLINSLLLIIFQRPSFFWFPKSLPFLRVGDTIYDPRFSIKKMSSFQAGLAHNWQNKLMDFIKIRKKNILFYNRIQFIGFTRRYQQASPPGLIRFPVAISDTNIRESIIFDSDKRGLGVMGTYPDSINRITELRNQFQNQSFPVSSEMCEKMLTLPTHPMALEKDLFKITKLFECTLK